MSDHSFKKPKLPAIVRPREVTDEKRGAPAVTTGELLAKYRGAGVRSSLIGLSDATGSMARVWGTTRSRIRGMFERVQDIGSLELHWVAYRDYSEGEKILESSGWHGSVEPVLEFLDHVDCFGGADQEEAVEKALAYAADLEKGTRVVLIGDAAPHSAGDYREQAGRLRDASRPVYSFVVGNDPDAFRTFTEISEITGGECNLLRRDDDLLDFVSVVAADDMGGTHGLERLLEGHRKELSGRSVDFAERLLGKGNG